MLNCIYSQILTKQHSIGSKISNLNFVAIYFGHLTICLAMHQSIPAVPKPPPPPRANPRAFFKKLGKFSGVGTHKLSKCPGVGTKKEGKCPTPGIVTFQHFSSFFFIKQWIKRSNSQYFNAMVLKTSRTTVHVSLFWLYFIFLYIYIFFNFVIFFIFLFFTLSL